MPGLGTRPALLPSGQVLGRWTGDGTSALLSQHSLSEERSRQTHCEKWQDSSTAALLPWDLSQWHSQAHRHVRARGCVQVPAKPRYSAQPVLKLTSSYPKLIQHLVGFLSTLSLNLGKHCISCLESEQQKKDKSLSQAPQCF